SAQIVSGILQRGAHAPIVAEGRADPSRCPDRRSDVSRASFGRAAPPIHTSVSFRQAQGSFRFPRCSAAWAFVFSRCSIFATDVDPLSSGRNHRSAAQQWHELSDRLDSRINREAQLLRNLGAAALNPKCPQPGRCGADGIPIIRRDEAKLGVGYLQALASEVVYAWADLEYLHLLDADDFVEQLTDACALRRRLQHFGLAVG